MPLVLPERSVALAVRAAIGVVAARSIVAVV
jgi:hypothetical protein